MSKQTLYLCYFGLREPLVQTQVLPYLRQIHEGGIKVSILTFEPNPQANWTKEQIEEERKKLGDEGIEWNFLTYHKRPSVPATFYDVFNGARFALKEVRKSKNLILHARGQVALAMALIARSVIKCRMIFDIRGVLAEEYADAGVWQEHSLPFKMVKSVERQGLEKADQIVVLTNKMRDYLVENKLRDAESIQVIPCCVDFSRVTALPNSKAERFELIYAGSVTGLYMLEEMGRFFLSLKTRRPSAFFRVLTASAPENVLEVFNNLGIKETDFAVQKVSPREVINVVQKAHLAISFRKPTFSQIAASPTKIPEYLAAGLPVISNQGIGDMDSLIEESATGIVIKNFERESLEKAVDNALTLLTDENLAERCRQTAIKNFDLESVGKTGYLSVYKKFNRG